MLKEINTMDDVKLFSEQLVREGTNFHPDDDFTTYTNLTTGQASFTQSEASLRNKLMGKCFVICEQNQVDIYDYMGEIFLKKTGLSKFIPLPSEV